MIINITYGFNYKGRSYGWIDKELYRLSFNTDNGRAYPLKKLKKVAIGRQIGYLVGGDRKSIPQLQQMTEVINNQINRVTSDDLPF